MKKVQIKAGAGIPDPNFGDEGVVDLSNEAVPTLPYDILALADGKFLYADGMPGNPYGVRLRRMNANGFFDRSFGEKGWVEVTVGRGHVQYLKLSNYLRGGWLLTCAFFEGGDAYVPHVFVMQLDFNGQPVPSFGENGSIMIDVVELVGKRQEQPQGGIKQDDANDIGRSAPITPIFIPITASVLPDGKILLLHGLEGAFTRLAMLIRLHPNGSLDKTFNGAGFSLIKPEGISSTYSVAHCLAVQKDGKILVSGSYLAESGNGGYVMRIDANGQFDTGFNGGRAVTIAEPGYPFYFPGGMSIRESDGAIVVVGYAGPDELFAKNGSGFITVLGADGSFNLVFNGGRVLYSKMLPEGVKWEYCAWQEDDKAIIVGGTGGDLIDSGSVLVARFLLDGRLDPLFNGRGWAAYQPEGWNAGYQGMTITQDNKLGLCSRVGIGHFSHCHVLRYLTS